jgi:arylsulfatase A-like enzyme
MGFGELRKRHNLLLITIDALRADHLGCLGYSKTISPYIDQLASEGILFTQAIANGPRSPASFPSMLASIYQSTSTEQGLPQQASPLAEILQEQGYATAGFCAGNVYISRYYGYQRGFDLFQDFITIESRADWETGGKGKLSSLKGLVRRLLENTGRYDPAFFLFSSALQGKKNVADMTKSEGAYPFEAGDKLNERAIAWLSHSRNEPFFLWIHYMDVHFPYLPRIPRYRLSDYTRFALSLVCLVFKLYSYPRRVLVDLYVDRIRGLDKTIAHLLEWLKDQGLYRDTLIVLTADHGEEFQDHGGWVHAPKLYDELLRVPLIIRGPGLTQGVVVGRQIGLIDLAPTILDLLGIEGKVASFQGTSFLPWLRGNQDKTPSRYVFSKEVHVGGRRPLLWNRHREGNRLYRICSCRSEDWKYIWDEEGNQRELYHLRLDPDETRNLAESEPDVLRRFEAIVRDQFSEPDSSESAMPMVARSDLSQQEGEELARRLRDLGYF